MANGIVMNSYQQQQILLYLKFVFVSQNIYIKGLKIKTHESTIRISTTI